MIRVVDGEALPPPDEHWSGESKNIGQLFPLLFFVMIFGSGILRAMFGRALGSLATGGVTGGIAWLFTQLLGVSLGAGVVALMVSLLLGFGNGGRWSSRPGSGGWRREDGAAVDSARRAAAAAAGSAAAAAASVAAVRRAAGR